MDEVSTLFINANGQLCQDSQPYRHRVGAGSLSRPADETGKQLAGFLLLLRGAAPGRPSPVALTSFPLVLAASPR